MDNHEVETSPQTKPPDEFWGLLRQCPHCKDLDKAVKEFNEKAKNQVILATVIDTNIDSYNSRENAYVCGPYTAECLKCHNTRLILTLKGRQLLGIIKTWLEEASPQWMAETEEFPF